MDDTNKIIKEISKQYTKLCENQNTTNALDFIKEINQYLINTYKINNEEETKINLKDYVLNIISSYSEDYAQEYNMYDLDDEDINNIIFYILNNSTITKEIQEEIEDYVQKRSVENEKF